MYIGVTDDGQVAESWPLGLLGGVWSPQMELREAGPVLLLRCTASNLVAANQTLCSISPFFIKAKPSPDVLWLVKAGIHRGLL